MKRVSEKTGHANWWKHFTFGCVNLSQSQIAEDHLK